MGATRDMMLDEQAENYDEDCRASGFCPDCDTPSDYCSCDEITEEPTECLYEYKLSLEAETQRLEPLTETLKTGTILSKNPLEAIKNEFFSVFRPDNIYSVEFKNVSTREVEKHRFRLQFKFFD